MKKLSFKTKVLSLALVAGVAAMAGALTLNRSSEQAAAAEGTAMFQMENSVRLRLNGNGLAFSAKMDGAKYNEIKNDENKSLYFIVMPSMYLGNVKTADGYNYSAAIVRDSNGVYDKESSHCLYVNASDAIFQNGDEYYALGGVSDVLEENRKLDFVAVACIETKTESGDYTYEYAAYPDGKTQMPVVSQNKTLSKSVLYASTDYSTQINQHYNWFGKGEYALTIATTEDYNALVGKINGGAALSDMELRINSGVDKTQATLNEGMALPATQTKFSTVKFYDDDGTTLLASADVNDGGNVTPATPAKAATEEFTYTFDKWVTEKGGDVAASFENITENTNVYAKYTAVKNKITITWKKNAADQGTTEIYNRGETPQYKGETLKNYFEGDKYYICKGFENIVPAEEDATYICQWEEHAGKLVTLSQRFLDYLRTDIAISTPTADSVGSQISFKGVYTKTGEEVDFKVNVFYGTNETVLNFQVQGSWDMNEGVEFKDAIAVDENGEKYVYEGMYIGIKDCVLMKGAGTWDEYRWYPCEMVHVSLSSWFGQYLYTDISIPTVTADKVDPEISFKATSTKTGGEVNFNVAPYYANGKDKLVFQVNYSGTEGEVLTFNNTTAIYNNQCIHIVNGTQLKYKGGKWYVAKTVTITGVYWANFMYTDIAKGELTDSSDEVITFSATSTVNGDVSFRVYAHHSGDANVSTVLFRIDYGTADDGEHNYTLTEGDIITFDNAVADYHGGVIRLNMKLIYQNGAWAVYNG